MMNIEDKSIEDLEDIYISLKRGHSLYGNLKFLKSKSLYNCSDSEINEFSSELVNYFFYKKNEIENIKKNVTEIWILNNTPNLSSESFLKLYRSRIIEEIRNMKLNKIINNE